MRANGVGVNVHYIPIHLQPYYENMGSYRGQIPESELYYNSVLSLPLYPDLTKASLEKVVAVLKDAIELKY